MLIQITKTKQLAQPCVNFEEYQRFYKLLKFIWCFFIKINQFNIIFIINLKSNDTVVTQVKWKINK